MKKQSIAVFDSGLGGISVLAQVMNDLPHEDFLYFGDSKYAPYGVKSRSEIFERCKHIVDTFVEQDVKAVVIACNTATSACGSELRELYPDLIIIGMEPALKPAVEQMNIDKKVIVLATQFTLSQKKFKDLVHNLDSEDKMIPIGCPELVQIVEEGDILNERRIEQAFDSYFSDIDMDEIDTIVLGCTHFIFYKNYLINRYPNIKIIDGNVGTSNNLKHQLEVKGLLSSDGESNLVIDNSKDEIHITRSQNLLESIRKADLY